MSSVVRDIVRGLRSWRRTPGSGLLVIFALGLSGGALITLVSLLNALLWRDLPVTHPEELVGVSGTGRDVPDAAHLGLPSSLFASLESGQNVFREFAGFRPFRSTAVINDATQEVAIEGVSDRYFETLGIRPSMGRLVGAEDIARVSPVATISFRSWQTRFGADPNIAGRTLRIRNQSLTVVGVAAREFEGMQVGTPADAWVPASLVPGLLNEPPDLMFFDALVGRLRSGVTLQQSKVQIESLWPSVRRTAAEAWPAEQRSYVLTLQPRIEAAGRGFSQYGVFYRRTLVLLVLSSVITIGLSCANLSGLLLARWATKEVDLAVQAALGASRSRLVAQVVGESLALSIGAVLLSAPLALWSARSLVVLLWNQPGVSSPLDLSPDYRVWSAMIVLACVVALGVSILPASRVWTSRLALTRGTRGSSGLYPTRWGRSLAGAQVALSVPLLVTAWTIAMNLTRLEDVDMGFRQDGVTVATLTDRGPADAAGNPVTRLRRAAAALQAVPGVTAAALCGGAEPVLMGGQTRIPVVSADGTRDADPFVLPVSPGFFETLGVPLVAGRDFAWIDDGSQHDVAIVSAGLARAVFPGVDPVGRLIRLHGGRDRLLEVVGVAADARLADPHRANQLFLYIALLQQNRQFLASPALVLLKSPLAPHALAGAARQTILALGRDDLVDAHRLADNLGRTLVRERVMRLGAFYFACLTTLLVFVGLYAVLNFAVMRRIPEIGLRMALGASPLAICRMVIREGLVTASAGLVVGSLCAYFSGQVIATSLTLVGSRDATAFGAATALVLLVTALSVVIPIRRATRVTPVEALLSY